MDAETGRDPTAPNANAGPPHSSRRPRAAMTLTVVGVAAVAFCVGLLVSGERGREPKEPGAETRTAPPATAVATPLESPADAAVPRAVDLTSVVERFHAARDEADRMARDIAERRLAEEPLSDEAHLALGHTPFAAEIPEIVSFRDYPFIRAVEDASRRRWILDPEDLRRASNAWSKTLAHARKLDPDTGEPAYRALDGARLLQGAQSRHFRDYVHEAVFASPYVVFRSDGERITKDELDRLPRAERVRKQAEMEAKRESFHRALAEKALIFRQLYAELLRRYGEDCNLRDLAAPFGGLPGNPLGKRSYRDGYAMRVWSFSTRKAFVDHHHLVLHDGIGPSTWGYYDPTTALVLYCDEPDDRAFEVEIAVRMGTQQLVAAFRRQKREWGLAPTITPFFDLGFSSYMGGVSLASDRTLTFHGISDQHLEHLRIEARPSDRRRGPPLIPARQLVSFADYRSADKWVFENLSIASRAFLHAHSWAFVHFLNEGEGRRREPGFRKFLEDMLNAPKTERAPDFARKRFADRFDLHADEDWARMDAEFERHVLDLVRPGAHALPPTPSLDNWPGYVTPRSLDLDSPDVTAGEEIVPARK